MKKLFSTLVILVGLTLIIPTGCKKESDVTSPSGESNEQSSAERGVFVRHFNSDVAIAWMNMQLQIMKTTAGISNLAFVRPYAYSGIVFYESVKPGMPLYLSLSCQLTAMPAMPHTSLFLKYYWPASANAAMASILKKMYPTTSAANVASVDSLENALNIQYNTKTDTATINRSADFGRNVAQLIFDWSETDGYLHANDPYTLPAGPGLWVPTPPAFAPATGPYWGNLRTMVSGSGNGAQPPAAIPYSEVPGSAFYNMAAHVYDVSQSLTQAQTDQAMYWRDLPGTSTAGHYLSILEQILQTDHVSLDKAAAAYALTCINVYDATISTWQTKYANNLVRPITYIQNVLGHTTWLPLLTTPAHPEYTSAHASLSAANAYALTKIFGANHSFTDHTFDYLGFPPRSYSSFDAIAEDAANSRVFAGIHYQPSCDLGLIQGKKVAINIKNNLHLRIF